MALCAVTLKRAGKCSCKGFVALVVKNQSKRGSKVRPVGLELLSKEIPPSGAKQAAAVGLGNILAIFALMGLLELSDMNTIIANALLLFKQAEKNNRKKGHRFFMFNSLTMLS